MRPIKKRIRIGLLVGAIVLVAIGAYACSSKTSSSSTKATAPATTRAPATTKAPATTAAPAVTTTSIPCGDQPGAATFGPGGAKKSCWNQQFGATTKSGAVVACYFDAKGFVACQEVLKSSSGGYTSTTVGLYAVDVSGQSLFQTCNQQPNCPALSNPEGWQTMPSGSQTEAYGIVCKATADGVTCTQKVKGKGFTIGDSGYTAVG